MAGWCSWLSRIAHTDEVLGSSPSLVISFYFTFFTLIFVINIDKPPWHFFLFFNLSYLLIPIKSMGAYTDHFFLYFDTRGITLALKTIFVNGMFYTHR